MVGGTASTAVIPSPSLLNWGIVSPKTREPRNQVATHTSTSSSSTAARFGTVSLDRVSSAPRSAHFVRSLSPRASPRPGKVGCVCAPFLISFSAYLLSLARTLARSPLPYQCLFNNRPHLGGHTAWIGTLPAWLVASATVQALFVFLPLAFGKSPRLYQLDYVGFALSILAGAIASDVADIMVCFSPFCRYSALRCSLSSSIVSLHRPLHAH